jgi:hypothetical protein
MQAIYPELAGHVLAEQSVMTTASKIFAMLKNNTRATIAYVTDSNDWAWAGKLLNDYNGKEGPHGYYKFAAIRHVESPRVSSATALRTAARAGDEAAFYAASGTDPKLTVNSQTYFETVVNAVQANPEKVKKVAKKKPEPAVAEVSLGNVLLWPEVVNKVNSAFKAMGWKGRRKGDDAFIYSTKGQETDDQWYFVIIDNAGEGFFKYALGTVEEGDPHIGDRDTLPATEASISELMNAVREGFGLGESMLGELSTEKLAQYKKAAGADAKKADADGNYARGDKRFKGINKATNKQFDNDLKKHGQQGVAEASSPAQQAAIAIAKKKQKQADESLKTDNPCWKGYKPVGTKKKDGRTVPNCVPKK